MTLLLLTAFGLIDLACRQPKPILVPLGDSRIVGQVKNGIIAWEPGENGKGIYIIVTKAFATEAMRAKAKVELLELELKKRREEKEQK